MSNRHFVRKKWLIQPESQYLLTLCVLLIRSNDFSRSFYTYMNIYALPLSFRLIILINKWVYRTHDHALSPIIETVSRLRIEVIGYHLWVKTCFAFLYNKKWLPRLDQPKQIGQQGVVVSLRFFCWPWIAGILGLIVSFCQCKGSS